jgi:hypothetical protein
MSMTAALTVFLLLSRNCKETGSDGYNIPRGVWLETA